MDITENETKYVKSKFQKWRGEGKGRNRKVFSLWVFGMFEGNSRKGKWFVGPIIIKHLKNTLSPPFLPPPPKLGGSTMVGPKGKRTIPILSLPSLSTQPKEMF
jgi:hypothetical protein